MRGSASKLNVLVVSRVCVHIGASAKERNQLWKSNLKRYQIIVASAEMTSERAQVETSMRDSGRAQVAKKNRYKTECFYVIRLDLTFESNFDDVFL